MFSKLNSLNHLDIWLRVVRVFIFAFLGAWVITGNAVSKDALASAFAAGCAAAYHYVKQMLVN